jgi:hypothetical protein
MILTIDMLVGLAFVLIAAALLFGSYTLIQAQSMRLANYSLSYDLFAAHSQEAVSAVYAANLTYSDAESLLSGYGYVLRNLSEYGVCGLRRPCRIVVISGRELILVKR